MQATTGTATMAPKMPNSIAPAVERQHHRERVDAHVSAHHEAAGATWASIWLSSNSTASTMTRAAPGPCSGRRPPTARAAGDDGADQRDEAAQADQHREREGQGDPEDRQRDGDHDPVERGDDEGAPHVVAERCQAARPAQSTVGRAWRRAQP